jgi:hypothetical protein
MRTCAFSSALIVLASVVSSCDNDDMVVQTHEYNARDAGTLTLDPVRAIVVANELGPVIIEGGSDTSLIRWFLDKNVSAESQAQAAQLFPRLSVTLHTVNDTAFISLNSVPDVNFRPSSLSLTLPYWIPCTLRRVAVAAVVSYLRSTFTGENVGNTTILGHEGNCILTGVKGEISVEMALPDSGLCKVAVDEGNILLKIPASTSSLLSLTTGSGAITYSGLIINDLLGSTPPLSLTGRLASGRGHIELATGRGNINLVGL